MHPGAPVSPPPQGVAKRPRQAGLIAGLHQELLARAGASLVLQRVSRAGDYRGTSGTALRAEAVWLRDAEARAIEALAGDAASVSSLDALPTLRGLFEADAAIIMTIAGTHHPAYLAVAAADGIDSPELTATVARARIEFGLALELERLAREGTFHRRLQEILLLFSRGASPLAHGLETVSRNANDLFGTKRTSVWLHDRRERELVLLASSGPMPDGCATRLSTADSAAPAARGLRLERAQTLTDRSDQVLVAPLRGWRRALGTLVLEGEPPDLNGEQYIEFADELARQLAAGIETVQLVEEILRQRRLLEDTFNSLADLVVVTDSAQRVVQTNEVFAARLRTARAELLNRPLADLVGGEMATWVQAQAGHADESTVAQAAGALRTQRFEDERLHGTFAATVTPLINGEGDPVGHVLVARDITQQTRLEAEQEALRHRLAQSEKLASLGQFVAGIAHEMNNPLQSVLGHLELLISASEAARPLRRELRRIYQEGDRAAKIVHNLLVFTGSRRMTRKRLSIEDLLSRTLASRRAALKRCHIEVVRERGKGLPTILGDALLLHQAFLNVIINAEYAVTLPVRGGRRIVVQTATDDTRRVVLTIRDSGPGIPAEILPRIFDPFFTTREVGEGTGLGLAITYGIIQEHGGSIHASNAVEGGAEFVIKLPGAESRK